MIPQFPAFKKLELSDKAEIEKHTSQFPPYSDFNFTSMWSWDIKEEVKISCLNKNLVVRFSDYITGEPFYSFIGNNKINETAFELMYLSVTEGIPPKLHLIPEILTTYFDEKIFSIKEQQHQFDYILSVDKLLPYDTSLKKLSTRRKVIKKFKESNSYSFVVLDIQEVSTQKDIEKVFLKWESNNKHLLTSSKHLQLALKKLFTLDDFSVMKSFGVFLNGELIGYSINEYCNNGYIIGHFQHGNKDIFDGIYALLMHESAPFFKELGSTHINLEQDLGIPGLKKWKSSHNPALFLKKYEIELRK